VRLAFVALLLAASACDVGRQLASDPADLADYRAYRTAEREGARLARAQHYLDLHPGGSWAKEVRAEFEAEEPPFFEKAKTSESRAVEYVVDLPRGPHADAARTLLQQYVVHADDFETTKLLQESRHTAALLDRASTARARVGEHVMAGVAALLDSDVYGARLDQAPLALRRILGGDARTTWGGAWAMQSDAALPFVVPTPAGATDRVVNVEISVHADRGRIVEGRVWGPDLFVRWAEAETIKPLDESDSRARGEAATFVKEILSGAFESVAPAARCATREARGELLVRVCDGWTLRVEMGEFAGAPDVVFVRGPARSG
jgi:hypothetical protein